MTNNWLREDALFLRKNDRQKSCLVLLLCLVDSLAKENNADTKGNRKDYLNFLQEKLSPFHLDRTKLIMSDELTVNNENHKSENNVEAISSIIYHEFRNYFVHEGDARETYSKNILINYSNSETRYTFTEDGSSWNLKGWSTDFGDSTGKWIIDANWIIDLLLKITALSQ